MLAKSRQALALELLAVGAIRFGRFRLKLHEKNPDAPLSPIYIDLRRLRSFPDIMDAAVEVYRELANGLKFDCYADIPTAATPIVAVLSHETRIPMISPRLGEKEHGTRSPIDGAVTVGEVALLIDDLVTRAESKLEAIAILEENGVKVHDLLVLVDREQGGVQELKTRGYSCRAAFRLTELLDFYKERDKINDEQYERTITYLGHGVPERFAPGAP